MTGIEDLKRRILAEKEIFEEKKRENGDHSQANLGMQIITELIAAFITGALLGYWLDVLFGTKPILFLVFIFIGILTGLINAFRVSYGMLPLAHPGRLQKKANEGSKDGDESSESE